MGSALVCPKPMSFSEDFWRPNSGPVVISPIPGRLVNREGEIDVYGEDWNAKARAIFEETGQFPIAGGAAGAWTFTTELRTKILQGAFAIGTDTFKMALVTNASNISTASTTFAGVTNELGTANGYTAGGITVTLNLAGTTSVTVTPTQAQWSATGAGITARWVVLYKSGANVYAFALCDSTPADVTATAGNTFTVASGTESTLA